MNLFHSRTGRLSHPCIQAGRPPSRLLAEEAGSFLPATLAEEQEHFPRQRESHHTQSRKKEAKQTKDAARACTQRRSLSSFIRTRDQTIDT
mmetsp:Transcript_38687/g.76051  ORF Transcript_38687/g.76051 Transcript_38687/m.76051 type:complete len:91 (-) Transcript_38687:218-490(-)